jgi:hypothetical protein
MQDTIIITAGTSFPGTDDTASLIADAPSR